MGPCGCAGAAVLGQAEGAEALCVRAAKPGAMSAEEQLELAEGSGSAPACRGGCCLRWGPRGRAGVGAGCARQLPAAALLRWGRAGTSRGILAPQSHVPAVPLAIAQACCSSPHSPRQRRSPRGREDVCGEEPVRRRGGVCRRGVPVPAAGTVGPGSVGAPALLWGVGLHFGGAGRSQHRGAAVSPGATAAQGLSRPRVCSGVGLASSRSLCHRSAVSSRSLCHQPFACYMVSLCCFLASRIDFYIITTVHL